MDEPVLIKEIIPGVVKDIVKKSEEVDPETVIETMNEIKPGLDSDF